jgi:hypothetical protein
MISLADALGSDVCFWHKADVDIMPTDVRFRGQSRHHADVLE